MLLQFFLTDLNIFLKFFRKHLWTQNEREVHKSQSWWWVMTKISCQIFWLSLSWSSQWWPVKPATLACRTRARPLPCRCSWRLDLSYYYNEQYYWLFQWDNDIITITIIIIVLICWCSTHQGSQRGRRCCLKSRRNCRPLYLVIAMIIKIIIMIMIIIMLIMLVKSAVEVDDLRVRVDRAGNMRGLLFRNSVDHLLVGQTYRAVWALLISI